MLHRFKHDISKIEPPKLFTWPFHYVPHQLSVIAAEEVKNFLATHPEWSEEISRGKMFGVLVVEDSEGDIEVCPVYQTLAPENYFNYIYGGTTQWAEGSNYDGCTFLSAKPTI